MIKVDAEQENQEQEISTALRQLAADHQHGRLSMQAYRKLRQRLLEMANSDQAISATAPNKITGVRPGFIVWIAISGIIFLLLLLGWLLR